MVVDEVLVARLCRGAAARTGGTRGAAVEVVTDPLDGSVWARLTSWRAAGDAVTVLAGHGLTAVERSDCRVQVTGWDARLLRRRLGMLLSGVDDLRQEWEATAELARYHRDRRRAVGEEPEIFDVVADVEGVLRDAVPIPHRAPAIHDVDSLRQLVEAAHDAYAQLIAEHVEYAARVLERDQQHAS